MASNFPHRTPPRAQVFAENAFAALSRFLHIEAVSGILLLIAAAAALIWANSPYSDSYHALWHARIGVDIGGFSYVQSLHFWINDALMTVFFLVVGMEIRREIHEGALASIRLASLPLAAAVGGVLLPAAIYLVFNTDPATRVGWAVPTATDIAFAVGVLALLGRAIPGSVRIFLLALAIIDDIVAVLIIALFYSGGLDYTGLAVAALGIAMVLGLQRVGAGSALAYIVPGAVLWTGLLMTGAHPTLAGVVLGLLTPVALRPAHHAPLHLAASAVGDLQARQAGAEHDPHHLGVPLRQLRLAQRDMLPPVTRVQMALHPWVAFGVMPLFALANAGVTLDGINLAADGSRAVLAGVLVALALGKPMGVVAASWLAVRVGGCQLPEGMNWPAVWLVGLLAGIGFTMSIFIATLAFQNLNLLAAAKLGVLMASVLSALLGLAWGRAVVVRRTRSHSRGPDPSSA